MLKEMYKEKMKKVKPKKLGTLQEVEKEHYPTFYISSDTLPDIKEWEVGKEYKVMMTVKQKSQEVRSEGKEEKYNADFEIREIAVVGKKINDEESKKEKYMNYVK